MDVSIAKTRKVRGSNYVQIATVDAKGEPHCRTVVFRGFLNSIPSDHQMYNTCQKDDNSNADSSLPCIMKMCTDGRSKKMEESANQPIAEMVWWFPKTSEQYRIRGPLIMIGEQQEDKMLAIYRKELWGNLSDPARESFLNPVVPGIPYSDPSSNEEKNIGGRDEDGKVVPPPSNFVLMLLDPQEVDYLRLTGSQYRQKDLRNKDTRKWNWERLNP